MVSVISKTCSQVSLLASCLSKGNVNIKPVKECLSFQLGAVHTHIVTLRIWKKREGKWTRKVEIRNKYLAVGEAHMATFWPTPGFKLKGELLFALGSKQRTPISLKTLHKSVFQICKHTVKNHQTQLVLSIMNFFFFLVKLKRDLLQGFCAIFVCGFLLVCHDITSI